MKTYPNLRTVLICAAALSFAGCAHTTNTISVGADTYTITRKAGSGFDHDTDKLKAEVQADAEKYCADHGKQLKIISVDTKKPLYTTGYATATITFRALNPGDPGLLAPAAAPAMASDTSVRAASSAAPAAASYQVSGDMYTQLLKLDDLRKKGILTEEEFQSEKKKILNRSQ